MSDGSRDKGWEYLHTNHEEGSFYEDDGSWGTQNTDGSGSYYGADGSWGTKNADGSASFYGADGSWGYRNADGSSSYYGKDGVWGYKNADGSGAYYGGASGDDSYFDADTDSYQTDGSDEDGSESSDSGSWADLLAGVAGLAIGIGAQRYSQRVAKERAEEAERQAEAERIRLEKEKERQIKSAQRKKRIKAFLFKGKKVEIPCACDNLIGKDIKLVIAKFADNAFNNINAISIKDVCDDSEFSDGEVEQVAVDGRLFFEKGELIPYDAEITITYHLKKEITMPFSSRSVRNKNYDEISDQLYALGFTEIYVHAIKDLTTGWIKKDGAIETIAIGTPENKEFKKKSIYTYDTPIYIEYHTFKNK